jgi:hypothetical protein
MGTSRLLCAQLNRGQIEGIVTDPQGAVVPEVSVTITDIETNVSENGKTNNAGYYRVLGLVPGKYRAHFEMAGFARLDIAGVEVTAGQVSRLDTQLTLGQALQKVEVRAGVPLLETSAANSSSTLTTHTINDLPLQGRDLMQLVFLVPGVNSVAGPPGTNFGFSSEFGSFPDPSNVLGSNLSVNGGQAGANAWYLDGNLNLSSLAENATVNPSPDSVSEFQAITSAFAAEYSRTGGAIFNVVLKSGSNKLHGDVYEFTRQSATNARNPFTSVDEFGNLIKDRQLHYNNFGGTLGGPVVLPHLYNGRNKTFFFFSWDARVVHLLGAQTFTVPTALERQGNFSEDPNVPLYGISDPFTSLGPASDGTFARSAFGTPLVANGCTGYFQTNAVGSTTAVNPTAKTCNFASQVPTGRLDPVAMYFMNTFPLPNFNSPLSGCPMGQGGYLICQNYHGDVGTSQVSNNISIKIDHQSSEKNKWFFEMLLNPGTYRDYQEPWTGPTSPVATLGAQLPMNFKNQLPGVGNTHTFSPTLINEFRYNFSRQNLDSGAGAESEFTQVAALKAVEQELAPLQLPTSSFNPIPGWGVSVPGGQSIGFGYPAWESAQVMSEAHTIMDNVTKIQGRHTLKAGLVYRLDHSAWNSSAPTDLYFTGTLTRNPVTGLGGGAGLSQFMLGAPDSNSNNDNTGLWIGSYRRWRYWGTYFQDDFRVTPSFTLNLGLRWDIYGFPKDRWSPMSNFCFTCSNPVTDLPGKVIYAGDPGFPKGSDLYPASKNNLGPRVNFSWSPFADHKTVIRAGYDIFTSDASDAMNFPGQVSEGGWQVFSGFEKSWFPQQCASFSGQCVPFPLDDTTTNKSDLTFPPISAGFPAESRSPLLGQRFYVNVKGREPMVQMWGFEIQRELPANLMLSAGYVGSHGTHLLSGARSFSYVHTQALKQWETGINATIPITDVFSDPTTVAALEQTYGSAELPRSILLQNYPFFYLDNIAPLDGTSIYNALNVKVQKQFSHGFNFVVAYTNSKKITNATEANLGALLLDPIHSSGPGGRASSIGITGAGYQDPDNLRDRVIAPDDVPQMLNVAGSYELPFGNGRAFLNRKGLLNGVFGGWKLTLNFNAESGVPLGVQGICDNLQAETGTGDCRTNLVGNPQFTQSRSKAAKIADWINPAAFEPSFGSDQNFWANYDPTDPRAWQFGNAGPRLPSIRSPAFWNVDSSLSKRFNVSEASYFEFRWESFNALNHMNLGLPNTSFCLPPTASGTTDLVHQAGCSFGRITNIATDPRSLQFALKFYW